VTRAIFDCVILLQAAGRPSGPAAACLQAVRDGRLELFVSLDILAEVRDVLTRPKTLTRWPSSGSWHRPPSWSPTRGRERPKGRAGAARPGEGCRVRLSDNRGGGQSGGDKKATKGRAMCAP